MSTPQALYRFYGADDVLLYVGITMDLPGRWKAHRDDKPWWTEVARCTVEHYPDRTSVLEAERAAIQAERPRYNVVHNRTMRDGTSVAAPQVDRLLPVQVDDWIALGLSDGRCPVGAVVAYDDQWVSVRLKDFLMGSLTNHVVAVRWAEVERVELAYPEDAQSDDHGRLCMDDEHLGLFQSGWKRHKLGKDTKEPVDQAIWDVEFERRQEAARWEEQRDQMRRERAEGRRLASVGEDDQR